MPSKTKKQAKFMRAAAHNPEFAAKAGIPQTVAKEFNNADTKKEEIEKSNYGPKGTAAGAQYQAHANQERKANNTGDVVTGIGRNKNVKAYSSKPGQLSAKQQAAAMHTKANQKANSGPVKSDFSDEEKKKFEAMYIPPSKMKKEEIIDEEADGKQEIVEGKEPLKKDPKARWKQLKKTLDHKSAFMNLEEELSGGDQPQEQGEEQDVQANGDLAGQMQQELSPEQSEEAEQPEDDEQQEAEAVSPGDEEQQDDQGAPELSPEDQEKVQQVEDGELDPQELIDALKEEGYSDQEIAYIVHGHHAPEVDPTKQAKAQATQAMSEHELDAAGKMAEIERQHALASMEQERSHKQRMSDLEYSDAQKQKSAIDMDQAHKQRMLDLEYERAKKETEVPADDGGELETQKEMKRLEVEKKRLELKLREQEMKLELEFKQREHELKLKMMEQQLKEQAKQKSEISGIKHEQKLSDVKSPPKKKPLKKSEEEDEQQD